MDSRNYKPIYFSIFNFLKIGIKISFVRTYFLLYLHVKFQKRQMIYYEKHKISSNKLKLYYQFIYLLFHTYLLDFLRFKITQNKKKFNCSGQSVFTKEKIVITPR
jgi:hypothetical protein